MRVGEVIAGVTVTVALGAVLVAADAFDWMYKISRAHESWELDEIVLATVAAVFGLVVYMLMGTRRRVREAIDLLREKDATLAELAETKEALNVQARLFAGVFNDVPDAMILANTSREIIDVNPGCEALFGYARDELVGLKTEVLYESPEEYARQGELRFNMSATKRLEPYTVRYRAKDGTVFPGETIGAPILDAGSDTVAFIGVIRDIRDRIKSEDARSTAMNLAVQAQERLEAAIDAIDEGFAIFDKNDRLAYFNEKYAASYPKARAHIRHGVTFEDLAHKFAVSGDFPDAAGREEEWVRERMTNRRKSGGTIIQHMSDGRFLKVVDRKTDQGDTVGYRMDVTRLKEAQQAAEAASRTKSEFLANMSHEIRTPLNAIQGLTGLALTTDLTDRQKDYLTKIGSSSRNLLGIITDLLDFSRLEAGKMEIRTQDFVLKDVIEEVISLTSLDAEEKGLPLNVQVPDGFPQAFHGDPLRITQVLANLVSNAVKFTDKGGVDFIVSGSETEQGGQGFRIHHLCFEVRDTGIGISDDKIDVLFQPFSQADLTTKRRYGGTGLGLSISRGLADLLGGTISVESIPGAGSVFTFEVDLPTAAHMPAPTALAHNEAASYSVAGLQLLVAEDNEINQQVMREMLEAEGCHVTIAKDGLEAVEMVTEQDFDAVLMDLQMPEMDGYEATVAIRGIDGYRSLPIIAVTAHAHEEERQRCFDTGMDEHIPKPVNPVALLSTLSRLCRGVGEAAPYQKSAQETAPPEAPCNPSDPEPRPASDLDGSGSSLPAELPGFDLETARGRLRGNDALLAKFLNDFHDRYMDLGREIRSALEREDVDDARLKAHSLKGVSGNLSADRVYGAARDLDTALKGAAPDAEVQLCLTTLEAALDEVSHSLDRVFGTGQSGPGDTDTESGSAETGMSIGDLVSKIDALIAEQDDNAVVSARALARAVEGVNRAKAEDIAEHLAAADYARARDDLDILKARLRL